MAQKGCVKSLSFDPDVQVRDEKAREEALVHLQKNDFRQAITTWFKLPLSDNYVYHAITSTQLAQVQEVIDHGRANGLHDWYRDEDNKPLPPPPPQDIEAYIHIFLPSTSTTAALKGFESNAKRDSIRRSVAGHLTSKRFLHPHHPLSPQFNVPKSKKPPPNPYLDFWSWSCRNLEWCGPCPESERTAQSHHVLPVFMHHFGCVVPSYEALELLRRVARGRPIVDAGSGNGYWSFMLRQHGATAVPVDSAQSTWRVTWVSDTVVSDAARWLSRKENAGGRDMVLLMVYPIVGGGVAGGVEGGFTRGLMAAYKGDTVAVVGTQNHNGYTGFRGMTMDEYVEKEQRDWEKVVQIPLPSFAGKDEALYIFQRREPKSDPA
ncbi:hypothetical protein VTK73DRAFT_2830 [Phialemonium thermophilum]|uniref:Uncharacterized protein n=1 Tax=Phialemonium thermophilum TaxID=223376 RepID=A0ABR3X250_9PEZI